MTGLRWKRWWRRLSGCVVLGSFVSRLEAHGRRIGLKLTPASMLRSYGSTMVRAA
jgi:hypothetical protein